jgi:hypothetical protein
MDPSLAYDVSDYGHLGYDETGALGPVDPDGPVQNQYDGTWAMYSAPNDDPRLAALLARHVRRAVGSECDDPPALGDGPFVAAGWWPLLSASQASPTVFRQNRSVLWTFSDDFASCSGACTHAAEYSVAGSNSWTGLSVSSDAAQGYAWVELPITSLQSGTTYEFRYTVTDCASQSTQSGTYYFRVTLDAPPQITGGPWLAGGTWPALPTSASGAVVLNTDYAVLWTFSDDYAACAGLCTHRARYRKVGEENWTWVVPQTDPTGTSYAYTTLPVSSLANGTYQFQFDVRDCAGQYTFPPHYYYFTVDVVN